MSDPAQVFWESLPEYKRKQILICKGLFKQQKAVYFDKSKRKAAICSRRSGKSHLDSAYLCCECIDTVEADLAYIGLTRGAAKKIIFNPLIRLDRTLNLGLDFNRSDLTITDPITGNTIYITGAHTENDTERLRGLKLKLAILDECASFRAHLNYLIEEILEPTLIDTRGTMLLTGTPSANPNENYFHYATKDPKSGYSVHEWTILDNPHIPHASDWLKEYRERKGWDESHPIYQREWLGKWTYDVDSLVYKYHKDRSDFTVLPSFNDINYVIGADIGFNDAFTISVLAYSYKSKTVWQVDEFCKSGLIPSEMAEVIRLYQQKYNPTAIVADHGGLGKAICEEFKRRYGLPIKPAEKINKLAYIELLNGDLLSGSLKIKDNSLTAAQMKRLQWDSDNPTKEDPRTPNDLCDSTLYAWREARHYMGEVAVDLPKEGSREWADKAAIDMIAKEMSQYEEELEKPRQWWEN